MSNFLRIGQQVELRDGRRIMVVEEIGQGAQGIVYSVKLGNKLFALKWFFVGCISSPATFYQHLAELIRVGAPSASFAWAEELTHYTEGQPFGYVMKLIPHTYMRFSEFLTANVRFSNVSAMIDASLNLVDAIERLHRMGFSFNDLHDENIFFDPHKGKVILCDTDNVTRQGEHSEVLGKPGYMAPEVVSGASKPNIQTDRHALAVILFQILVGDHPLLGRRTLIKVITDRHDAEFFGTKPLFIFDEKDSSNAPHPRVHRNAATLWKVFPSFVRDLFRRGFSQSCLLRGAARPLERQWFHALMRLKSSLNRCPHCGEEIFLESDRDTVCPSCRKIFKPAGYLAFNARQNVAVTVPIIGNATLYNYHTEPAAQDWQNQSAVILQRNGHFGLLNRSHQFWRISTPGGAVFIKNPGEVLVLGAGFRVDFGDGTVAEVIVNR